MSSVTRTWVPVIIGGVIAWLSAKVGFVLDESSQVGLTIAAMGAVINVYYAIIRKIEARFPQIGWLLGLAKSPGYEAGTPPQHSPGPLPDAGGVEDGPL